MDYILFFQIYLVEYIENLVGFLLHFTLFPLIVSYSVYKWQVIPKKDVENLWGNLVGFAQKKTVAPNLSRGNNRPQTLCFGTEHEEEH